MREIAPCTHEFLLLEISVSHWDIFLYGDVLIIHFRTYDCILLNAFTCVYSAINRH